MSDFEGAAAPPAGAGGAAGNQLADATALCLSGGGYRAMLFHVGALWRLNEARFLPRLSRVSSVSGGSITAGVLGAGWNSLGFDDDGVATRFSEVLVEPIRRMASVTIDRGAVLRGVVLPGSVGTRIAAAYDKVLFGGKTLQDLPAPGEGPRFVVNATNLQSGTLWRFSRPYLADYRVGRIDPPGCLWPRPSPHRQLSRRSCPRSC